MEKNTKKPEIAQGAERERTISVTQAMLEELKDEKLKSIVIRLMEQSDPGTTGKTIFTMAKMLYKQTELDV
jgi:hypothetical protein